MEIVLALILGLGVYEYMNKDDVDPTKHQVVDVVDVRTADFDMTHSVSTAKWVSGGYYSNGVLQESEVKWVLQTD